MFWLRSKFYVYMLEEEKTLWAKKSYKYLYAMPQSDFTCVRMWRNMHFVLMFFFLASLMKMYGRKLKVTNWFILPCYWCAIDLCEKKINNFCKIIYFQKYIVYKENWRLIECEKIKANAVIHSTMLESKR